MRSCSASEAAAGSPDPPSSAHVVRENWYLPRYWPDGETAVGSPPDSHWAIFDSAVPASVVPVEVSPESDCTELPDSPSELSVAGPAMPSTARPWLR